MEILPSLLGFIDAKVRTFKKRIVDAAENPSQVAEQINDNLPATIDETMKDPGNFIGGGAGTFISRGAKSWDQPRYIEAVKLKVKGVSNDEIWAKTGTWLDTPDMIPRQEISDLGMQFSKSLPTNIQSAENVGITGELSRIVEHPQLNAAHPGLWKKLTLTVKKGPKLDRKGSFDPNTNHVTVQGATEEDLLYVLSHELQHTVQQESRMATGGSPKNITLEMHPLFQAVKKSGMDLGSTEAEATKAAANMAYKYIAGEAEARAVMDRLLEGLRTGKHPERAPWRDYDIPLKDAIVHFYHGKSAK